MDHKAEKKSQLPSGILYIISSAASFAVDYLLRYILMCLYGVDKEFGIHIFSTIASSVVNFNLNKYWVFKKRGSYIKDMISYYCVFVPRTATSVVITSLVIERIRNTSPLLAVIAGMVVDGILFVACYFIQKIWVFGNKDKE